MLLFRLILCRWQDHVALGHVAVAGFSDCGWLESNYTVGKWHNWSRVASPLYWFATWRCSQHSRNSLSTWWGYLSIILTIAIVFLSCIYIHSFMNAMHDIDIAIPSVYRLSVWVLQDCVKMTKLIIEILSPPDTPIVLVYSNWSLLENLEKITNLQ